MTETEKEQKTLAQEIEEYEPNTTGNISDLESFDISEPIVTKVFKQGTEEEYKKKVLVREGKEYYIPFIVINDMKEILREKPKVKAFQVLKSGTGKEGTRYRTLPHITGV